MKKLFCIFLTALLISTTFLGCRKETTSPETTELATTQVETSTPVTEDIETTALEISETEAIETDTIVEMPIDFVIAYCVMLNWKRMELNL